MLTNLSAKQFFARSFLSIILFFVALLIMSGLRESRLQQNYQAETGLASASSGAGPVALNEPIGLWTSTSLTQRVAVALIGEGGYYQKGEFLSRPNLDQERKIVRAGQMLLIVKNPRESAERIQQIAAESGGYTGRLQISEQEQQRSAAISVRVPANSLEQVRTELRNLGRAESDSLESEDVSKRYVDSDASLRNYRAQEQQYLTIMRRAQKVSEILEVTEKLAEVRGEIEKTEGELRYLQHQVAMAAIAITLRTEADPQIGHTHWGWAYVIRRSFRSGLDNLAGYAEAMLAVLMNLPAIFLWIATIVLAIKLGWKLFRWIWMGFARHLLSPASRPERAQARQSS